MKVKELKDYLQKLPDDYEVKVSSHFVKEGETELKYFEAANEQFTAINDEFILGISRRDTLRQVNIIGVHSQAEHFGTGDFSRDMQ